MAFPIRPIAHITDNDRIALYVGPSCERLTLDEAEVAHEKLGVAIHELKFQMAQRATETSSGQ
jgi:hypothetical protein